MRKELDEKLCEKYPLIFKNRHADMTETAMCWGFECGDGWFNIIDVLCGMLYADYTRAKERYEAVDRKSTRLNSSHMSESRMPSSA